MCGICLCRIEGYAAATATAVVKKDNFGTLTAIAEPTMASIGATIADAKAGVEYLVVADDGDGKVTIAL